MINQNYGLIRQGEGNAVLKAIPIPKLKDDYILVRTVAIALNPTDWTTLDAKGDDGTLVGCDYAGIVEEVGEAVVKQFKKGDRVMGIGHGGNDANPETGAFARYIVVKGDIQIRIPDDVSFETAATAGVGLLTTGYGLYKILDLPWPEVSRGLSEESILVFGGSTSTGSIAIQFAKLSGYRVLTTCSPRHFDMVKERGADMVYDYRDPQVGEKINAETNNSLTKIFDTVAIESTAEACATAFGAQGGLYCNLLGAECPRKDVKSEFFLGYSMSGQEYIFEGDSYPAQPKDFVFAKRWVESAERLWEQGKWKCHPEKLLPGGLQGAVQGMQAMREGKGPSGEKWVYRADETEWPNMNDDKL
ncbi:hypothetical protein LTS14_006602 [Recurvomyces mirabilis]|nr:hypothetical protein LTS14_006602 [Recurvomyces mirabilis]